MLIVIKEIIFIIGVIYINLCLKIDIYRYFTL